MSLACAVLDLGNAWLTRSGLLERIELIYCTGWSREREATLKADLAWRNPTCRTIYMFSTPRSPWTRPQSVRIGALGAAVWNVGVVSVTRELSQFGRNKQALERHDTRWSACSRHGCIRLRRTTRKSAVATQTLNLRHCFFRTMLCIARVRLLSQYDCLSVTRRYCIKTAKHRPINELFSQSTIHTILVRLYETLCHYSDGDSLAGTWNVGRVSKNFFDQCLVLSRQ